MKASITVRAQRAFKKAINSIKRAKWSNTMNIVALSLVFILVHTTGALVSSAESVIQNLQRKVDIGVFFLDEASEYDIKIFLEQLDEKKSENEIKDYRYYSEDEELAEFEKRYPGRMVFLRKNNLENPLVGMVEIVPHNEKSDQLIDFLFREEFANVIDQSTLRKDESERIRIKRFLSVANFAEKSGIYIFSFFLIIATGLLFHAISTACKGYEKEISIMKLVGARLNHVRMPFIIEGVALASVAFVISFIIAFFLFFLFSLAIKGLFPDEPTLREGVVNFINNLRNMIYYDVVKNAVIVLILSFIGSFFGIEKYLRKKQIL
ncbi:MAG: permease-like cell division protein FtsX [Candidatus Gracilibacteria bacterium]|jgi:cell division protein FtsX|nr:permease-like cell division protein FtsX [Candidatus Gracilibacteria bacterium]